MDGSRFDAFAKTLAAGRSRRALLRLLGGAGAGLGGLSGGLSGGRRQAAAATPPAIFDLAAMALQPRDLGGAWRAGLGAVAYGGPAAVRLGLLRPDQAGRIGADVVAAMVLPAFRPPANPAGAPGGPPYAGSLFVRIVQLRTRKASGALFALLAPAFADGAQNLTGATRLGDQAGVWASHLEPPAAPAALDRVILLVRSDQLVAWLTLDGADQPPDPVQATGWLKLLAGRLQAGQTGSLPGVGAAALRLEGVDEAGFSYARREGRTVARFGESAADLARRAKEHGAARDVLESDYPVFDQAHLFSTALGFAAAAEAKGWLGTIADRVHPGFKELGIQLAPDPAFKAVGDASAGFGLSWRIDALEIAGYLGAVQSGPVVGLVRLVCTAPHPARGAVVWTDPGAARTQSAVGALMTAEQGGYPAQLAALAGASPAAAARLAPPLPVPAPLTDGRGKPGKELCGASSSCLLGPPPAWHGGLACAAADGAAVCCPADGSVCCPENPARPTLKPPACCPAEYPVCCPRNTAADGQLGACCPAGTTCCPGVINTGTAFAECC